MQQRTRLLIRNRVVMVQQILQSKLAPLHSFAKGFTLIELLVAVSIMLLLTGGGIASYITFNDSQQLQASTKMVQSYMRAAQTKARVGDRPDGCSQLQGYAVRSFGSTLSMVAVCAGSEFTVQSTELENVGTVTIDGSELDVTFNVLHGGAQNSGQVIVTSDSNVNSTESFRVSPGGEIGSIELESDAVAASPTGSPNPSQTTAASMSPSPSVFVFPSPTGSPLVAQNVILNAATGLSCSQVCVQNDFEFCKSIKTSTGFSLQPGFGEITQKYYSKGVLTCSEQSGSCTTVMTDQDATCEGNAANWTYCVCSNTSDGGEQIF